MTFWRLFQIVAVVAEFGSLVDGGAQQRSGWSMLIMLLVALLVLVIPHTLPVWSVLEALLTSSNLGGAIPLMQDVLSMGLAILTVWLATRLTRRRTW